jgi:hypothetical protein
MSIFALAKTKLSQGSKSTHTCERHKVSTDEAATFPVRISQNWFANWFLLVKVTLSWKPEANNPVLTIRN